MGCIAREAMAAALCVWPCSLAARRCPASLAEAAWVMPMAALLKSMPESKSQQYKHGYVW